MPFGDNLPRSQSGEDEHELAVEIDALDGRDLSLGELKTSILDLLKKERAIPIEWLSDTARIAAYSLVDTRKAKLRHEADGREVLKLQRWF